MPLQLLFLCAMMIQSQNKRNVSVHLSWRCIGCCFTLPRIDFIKRCANGCSTVHILQGSMFFHLSFFWKDNPVYPWFTGIQNQEHNGTKETKESFDTQGSCICRICQWCHYSGYLSTFRRHKDTLSSKILFILLFMSDEREYNRIIMFYSFKYNQRIVKMQNISIYFKLVELFMVKRVWRLYGKAMFLLRDCQLFSPPPKYIFLFILFIYKIILYCWLFIIYFFICLYLFINFYSFIYL